MYDLDDHIDVEEDRSAIIDAAKALHRANLLSGPAAGIIQLALDEGDVVLTANRVRLLARAVESIKSEWTCPRCGFLSISFADAPAYLESGLCSIHNARDAKGD